MPETTRSGAHTAVSDQRRVGDDSAFVTGEEQHRAGDLFRPELRQIKNASHICAIVGDLRRG